MKAFLVSLLILILLIPHASSMKLVVCRQGCEYTGIAEAINASSPGDYILVNDSGNYSESLLDIPDNLTIDFSGASLHGNISRYAMEFYNRRNITVMNGSVYGFDKGIFIKNASFIRVSNMTFIRNFNTIRAFESFNSVFEHLYIEGSSENGIQMFDSKNNKIKNSIISDSRGYGIYMENSSRNTIENITILLSGKDGIGIFNHSVGNTLRGSTITNSSGHGVRLENFCTSNRIDRNTVMKNMAGLGIYHSSFRSAITGNVFSYNREYGILLEDNSGSATLKYNNISFNNEGLAIREKSDLNTIKANNITSNRVSGILLKSSRNTVQFNYINSNSNYGLLLDANAKNNTITNNTICYNTHNLEAENTTNTIESNEHCSRKSQGMPDYLIYAVPAVLALAAFIIIRRRGKQEEFE